ncbi:hypothetical protein JCGZ_15464 [Jatropha curcas]|uniref:Uncharacterized protein n=1 Tax=Jatropha curcas TaxID=180498 RepID=A0A067LN68_JATCU|nr:hypothetical protein JCGZ_15464 [Jatropha curcas]
MTQKLRPPSCNALLLLLLNLLLFTKSEALQMKDLKLATTLKLGMEDSFNRLSLRGIKHSGPSPGGRGHRTRKLQISGRRRDSSGPTPGQGH